MQTSAAIATAAVAQERNPVATLKVDWDADGTYSLSDTYLDTYSDVYGIAIDDLSARVESLTIDRQLATDLPDEVSRSAGYSSAQLTAVLSGDPTTEADNAGSYFSPFNTASALYGKRRRWRTCQVQIGFDSTTLPVFTGKTTGLTVDSASRTATLEALDLAETMRGVVDLPLVVADNKATVRPNLNASWVVDYIARACGYYAAPPKWGGCVFHASFAGSAYSNVGSLVAASLGTGDLVTFTPGKFIQSTQTLASGYTLEYTTSGSLSTNDGGEALLEGWVTAARGSNNGVIEVTSSRGSTTANKVGLLVDGTTGHLLLLVRRTNGGASTTYDSGLVCPTGQLNYVAAHASFSSTAVTIQWRMNATSGSTTPASTSVTGQPVLTAVTVGKAEGSTGFMETNVGARFEAWQVANPGLGTGTPAWNDAYVGNATIQPSLNTLAVTAPSQTSGWDQLQQIAAAEFATVGFDESGNFNFYNRNRWTSAPYTTSQRTINAADSLTAIATAETIDQVRNHIRLTATVANLNAAGWVWATANVISVPASGSTTVTVDLGQPVYGLSTSIRYASTSGTTGQSQYRANRNRDGSGAAVSNLTFTVTVAAAQIATIVITNPNAFIVYLVTSAGFTDPQGTPSLALWGQPVDLTLAQQPDTTSTATTAPSRQIIDISDATSIGQHGDQLLEVSGNPWLQDVASLTTLANDLLARLKDPLPILDGLTIVGDPRLQLGDRVTVVEPTLGLNGDFFLTRIMSTDDASGYTQALTVRGIS